MLTTWKSIYHISLFKATTLIGLLLIGVETVCFGATPTISSVTGNIVSDGTLSIAGTSMIDEDNTDWISMFTSGTAYGFEGANYTADGYAIAPDEMTYGTWTYDTDIKLSGSQSFKGNVTVATKTGAGLYISVSGYDYYVRFYTRWDSDGSWKWPDSYIKMLTTMGPEQRYVQAAETDGTSLPTQINLVYDSANHKFDVENWVTDGRWYCVEARFKTSATTNLTVWIDNIEIENVDNISDTGEQTFIQFGMINMCCQGADFDLSEYIDNFTVSTSRIYPSAMVEIGDGPTYESATKVYQAPTTLSDTAIDITCDLTGLGSGPYYLWVTNNKQERSDAYYLSAGQNLTGLTAQGVVWQ